MNFVDRIKDSTTTTGTGAITTLGAATGFRALTDIGATGSTFCYGISSATEWEIGIGTLTSSTTFTRSVQASSNANALVNFSAGTKDVFCTLSAAHIAKLNATDDIAFAASVPLTMRGTAYMPQQTVSSVIAFTAAASPVKGAVVYVRLVADGTNAPTFTGIKEWGGSLGYDNRNGIVNEVQFFYDGYDSWYSISQQVGAVALDVLAPTASSAAVANATPTVVAITMSEAMDTGFVPAAAAFTVSGHTVSSVAIVGSTINLTCSAAFVNGEAARTAAYTQPGANNARDVAGNLLANFSGLAITNNVVAAATGVTMTGPTTGTTGAASSNFTVGVTPVGGTITGTVIVTPSDGGAGGTFTPTTRSLTTASPSGTFTYTAASDGAKTISATNNGGLTNPSNITYTASSSATVPGAPTMGTVAAADTTASVSFTPPASNGGSAITGYTATVSPGGVTFTGASSPITISGLTNNTTAYTVTVTATNSIGTGAASAASGTFYPAAGNLRLGSLINATEMGATQYSYKGNGTGFVAGVTGPGGIADLHFQSGVDGFVQMTINNFDTNSTAILGVSTGSASVAYGSLNGAIWAQHGGTPLYKVQTGVDTFSAGNINPSVVPANGDTIRVRRTGSTITCEISRAATPTTWIGIHGYGGSGTGVLYIQAFTGSNCTLTGLYGFQLA